MIKNELLMKRLPTKIIRWLDQPFLLNPKANIHGKILLPKPTTFYLQRKIYKLQGRYRRSHVIDLYNFVT